MASGVGAKRWDGWVRAIQFFVGHAGFDRLKTSISRFTFFF